MLQQLGISRCTQISDLSPLTNLPWLQRLDLCDCEQISDLAPLANLTSLQQVDISHCRKITNLTPLAILISLQQQLGLSRCKQIRDLTPRIGMDVSAKRTKASTTGVHRDASLPSELVTFSLFAPALVRPAQQFIIDFWAHLRIQTDEVNSLACEISRERKLGTKSGVIVSRGTLLSIVLYLPSLQIRDPTETILWSGEPVNASFIAEAPPDVLPGNHAGSAIVSVLGIPIAKVAFLLSIKAASKRDGKVAKPLPAVTNRPRSAFASYCSRDRADVLSRVQGMVKVCPDLNIFLDVISLRSGQDWDKQLRQQIPKRDVFFLFWSINASNSKEVDKEWRLALEMRGLKYIDPIPLVDPRLAPPPKELASLHFNDFYLAYIKMETSTRHARRQCSWHEGRANS
jgi:hypothetical protein